MKEAKKYPFVPHMQLLLLPLLQHPTSRVKYTVTHLHIPWSRNLI